MKTQTFITNSLTGLVAIIVLAIGAGAFVLSYDALHAVALQNGQLPAKAWIWPLLIDAPLVVFTLGLLVAQITRQPVKFWAGLVILYTLATIAFNLSHAPSSTLGWAVAVVAPAGLLLTTEALRHLAKGIIERSAHVASLAELISQQAAAQTELNRLAEQAERDKIKAADLKAELAALRSEKRQIQYAGISDETRQAALGILAERSDVSGAELGRLLGRSDTTGRRLKKELLPIVAGNQNGASQNGQGVTL